MSDSDISLDSDGCEIRSDDGSDSAGSLVDFIVDDTDDTDDSEWLPPTPINTKRVSVKPVRFADEVFESESEEDSE